MRPSISSVFFHNESCEEMVRKFIDCGYDCTEISHSHVDWLMQHRNEREFRRFIDDLGFEIPQGHLVYLTSGNITSEDNTYAIDNLKRNLDIFYELGVKSAVIHYASEGTDVLPIEDYFEKRVDAISKLCDHIKGTDMTICIENLSRVHDYDAGHILRMVKAINRSNVGICLDTGHLNISRRGNQYDFIKQAGSYLKALHVHDNLGEHDGLQGLPCDLHMIPFDKGNINWENVKRGLKEVGYTGLFNFEVMGGQNIPYEFKKNQAKYIKTIYKYFEF